MASLKGLPVESVFSPRKKKTWQNGKVVSDQTTRLLEICPRLIGLKWRCPVSFSTVSQSGPRLACHIHVQNAKKAKAKMIRAS